MSRNVPFARNRGLSPLVGVLALVALTVALAGVVAVAVGTIGPAEPDPIASFELAVDAEDDAVAIEHVAGDAVDVRTLAVAVTVDGEPLAEQPPVPFFSAAGFRPGPEGPFNEAADPEWTPGETATFRIAGTNAPSIDPGDEVVVTISTDGSTIARLEAIAA